MVGAWARGGTPLPLVVVVVALVEAGPLVG